MKFHRMFTRRLPLALLALSPAFTACSQAAFSNFITRSGDRLMDGSTPFRFMAVETFDVHYMKDNLMNEWRVPDTWEQEGAFKSISHMGGTANRLYALSVRSSNDSPATPRHIDAPGVYNETVFRGLDKALQFAEQYNIRLVISLIDGRGHWGGPKEYAAFRGKTEAQFWTDAQLKADYKAVVSHLLNRTNFYTGVPYKNNKTIFAWQLGNEMSSGNSATTYAWMSEMAAYVKSIDSNHLVTSGHYVKEEEIPAAYLSDPNIDIIDPHYYGYHGYSSLLAKLNEHVAITAGHRPMTVGEFGMDSTAAFNNLMDGIIAAPNVAGGLLWNYRYRASLGGYTRKDGVTVDGILYRGYRWPGYDASGGAWDERNALAAIRTKAYAIRGLSVPAVPVPAIPLLFNIASAAELSWRGSQSASSYEIDRATSSGGPWTTITTTATDDRDEASSLYTDASGTAGQNYYYRIRAKNGTGVSGNSNVVGPVLYDVANKAPSATLSVDSTNGSFTANLAVDGIKNTAASRWVSTNATSTHWFQMNWPTAKTVRCVKVWSGYPVTGKNWQLNDFVVQYWNGSAWVTVESVTDNLEDAYYGQYNWLSFAPVSTTRVRLYITKGSATDNYARVAEVEVY